MKDCKLCNNIKIVKYSYNDNPYLINIISFDMKYYCLCFIMANIKGRYNNDSMNALLLYEFKNAIENDGFVSINYNKKIYTCIRYNFINDRLSSNINIVNISDYKIMNGNYISSIPNESLSVLIKNMNIQDKIIENIEKKIYDIESFHLNLLESTWGANILLNQQNIIHCIKHCTLIIVVVIITILLC